MGLIDEKLQLEKKLCKREEKKVIKKNPNIDMNILQYELTLNQCSRTRL